MYSSTGLGHHVLVVAVVAAAAVVFQAFAGVTAEPATASIRAQSNGDVVIDPPNGGTVRVPGIAIHGNISGNTLPMTQRPALLLYMRDQDFHIQATGSGELYIDGVAVRSALLPTDSRLRPRGPPALQRDQSALGMLVQVANKMRRECALVASSSVYSLNDCVGASI